jgi:hypothetical protein
MKQLLKTWVFLVAFAMMMVFASASSTFAETIELTSANVSNITYTVLNGTIPGVASSGNAASTAVDPAWLSTGYDWISVGSNTGNPGIPGYIQVPDGAIVRFDITFSLPNTGNSGLVTVLSDDSNAVSLNGIELVPVAPGPNFPLCAETQPNCVNPLSVNLTTALKPGLNTLSFIVHQKNSASFGLAFKGSVTSVPEPASMLLLGTGIAGVAGAVRRRMKRQN